jgi:excisionase family DNA binding protein
MARGYRKAPTEEELLTRDEVAELLGIKKDWVGLVIDRHDFPFVVTGPGDQMEDYRFRRSEVEAWMKSTDRPVGPD